MAQMNPSTKQRQTHRQDRLTDTEIRLEVTKRV